MRRPPGTSRILWWMVTAIYPFMAAYHFVWSKCTKAGRAEEQKWKAIELAAKDGSLRKAFLANAIPFEPITRPIPEGPPTKDMLWIMDDEPTKGRDLLRQEAEEEAERQRNAK